MSVENLKNSLPEYAKDLKLNLSSIARTTVLNEQQLWGTLLATAAATKSASTLKEIASEAATTCRQRRTTPLSARRRSWA